VRFTYCGGRCPRLEVLTMRGETKERWLELCENAAIEEDSEQLMALIDDINRMLYEKEVRLKQRAGEESWRVDS
jgi:hypothetical protein